MGHREPRLRDVVLLRERVQDAGVYPFTVPVLRTFERLMLTRRVTFFIGEKRDWWLRRLLGT